MTVEYLAKKFAAAGLKPGGSGGSWFQDVPLRVFERQPTVSITLKSRGAGAKSLLPGKDITLSSHNSGHNQLIIAAQDFTRITAQFHHPGCEYFYFSFIP